MDTSSDTTLILGIGNLLWADEGFGVRCVERLAATWHLPEGVTVMDGGTQGLYLLPYVSEASHLLVFDAIDYGLPPGTLRLVEGEQVPRFMGAKKMSLHQTGFQEVLASAEMLGRLPRAMTLIGVQPVELDDFGGSLRPAVKARLPEAVMLGVMQLCRWGVAVTPRVHDAGDVRSGALDMERYEAGRPSERDACRLGDLRFVTTGEC